MVIKILFTLLGLSIGLPLLAAGQQKKSLELSDYQWKNRLLLIFAPSLQSDEYQNQLLELKGEGDGLHDRDMKIFYMLEKGTSKVDQETLIVNNKEQLRDMFNVVNGEFTVILIGKDGSEKLRSNSVLKMQKLFTVIDAMPMRQQEIEDGNN